MALIRVAKGPGGPVEYELARTSRQNILIKPLPQGKTKVLAPAWAPLKAIDAFVLESAQAIGEAHRRIDRQEAESKALHGVADGNRLLVDGENVILRRATASRPSARLAEGVLTVSAPPDADDEAVRGLMRGCLSKVAMAKIRQRLDAYIPLVGRAPGRIAIRAQKTRWGSCSSKRNLNFNWKLILAPPEALDYVVIHELCHLIEFSHSPRFWKLVEAIQPDYKLWRKWLKDHGRELEV